MPFAYDWVGGDIHGLSSLVGTLYGYPPKMADVVTALDKKVSQVLGVAAGVAGGVVAYGVGDYVHNYIEDFGQQWHQHGVLGIATDFGAAGVGTWDDTKGLVGDIGGAAKSVWHGVTSLF